MDRIIHVLCSPLRDDLSPVHTLTENGDCRRKVRLSQKTATVAEKCDCRRFAAEKCDCRRKRPLRPKTARKRRQSPNSATVALFCDSRRFRRQIVAEISDYSRQCGQAFTLHYNALTIVWLHYIC